MEKLTQKQWLFVQEYLVDLNGTKAAIRAGYSERTAEVQASRLLSNANVAEAVQAEMDKRSRRTAITADYVLDVIKGTIERCQSGADYNPGAVLKGAELLGRHLRLFASFAPTTR